jgi:hypothetical protein
VDWLIAKIGLAQCQNSLVGGVLSRGISGGEASSHLQDHLDEAVWGLHFTALQPNLFAGQSCAPWHTRYCLDPSVEAETRVCISIHMKLHV